MTLYQIIDTLKNIALTQPNVRTATDGDIYEKMNGNPSVRYGVFHVTQTTHTEDEQFDNYGFNLFVIDRLEVDDANRVSAQSTAKQILSNIIATFCETFDAEHEVITYQPFTQRFKDNTCGVWASVTMQVLKDYSCAEIFGDGAWRPEIVVINNQDITITRNGVYEPSEGYTGFGKVEVALDIPNVKESDTLYLMAGDNGVYKPESPYNAVGEVIYHVEPNQNKTIDVVENGEYVVMPDEGFGGLGAVEVNVDIPIQDKGMTLNYNGDYTIEPDENYVAMKKVNVKVDYKPKPVIPNGITLSGSTFSTIDMSNWDWSRVYDWGSMFQNCSNLETIENFPSEVEVLYIKNMFKSCVKLTTAPPLDTSKLTDISFLFDGCSGLTSVELSGTSNITNTNGLFRDCVSLTAVPQFDTSNVTTMSQMFGNCTRLTTIPPLDTSNVTTMSQMFDNCSGLTTIPPLDTSKVTKMDYMFNGCFKLTSVPPLDTSNVTTMSQMFSNCTRLTTIPPLDTSNVTKMDYLFENCSSLTSVPMMDTSKVTDMYSMFNGCLKLTSVPPLDISNVIKMEYMFAYCQNLQEVRFTGNPINLTTVSGMSTFMPTTGTLYYPSEYADAYRKIINAFPSKWVKVAE